MPKVFPYLTGDSHQPDNYTHGPHMPVQQVPIGLKARGIIQTTAAIFPNWKDANEYYTRQLFDRVGELRGSVGAASVILTLVNLNTYVKWFRVLNKHATQDLYINPIEDSVAANQNGNLECLAGEGWTLFLPVRRLSIIGTGASTTYRITFGW